MISNYMTLTFELSPEDDEVKILTLKGIKNEC